MPKISARTTPLTLGDTRHRILDAAAQSFVTNGYQNTRLAQVAKLAGVSRSTLYELFSHKEHILVAINDHLIEETLRIEKEVLQRSSDPKDAIINWLRTGFLVTEHYRNLLRIMYSDEVQPSLLLNREAINDSIRKAEKLVKTILQKGKKIGVFRDDLDTMRTAKALQNIHYFLTKQIATDHPLFELSPDHGETIVQITVNGILTPS